MPASRSAENYSKKTDTKPMDESRADDTYDEWSGVPKVVKEHVLEIMGKMNIVTEGHLDNEDLLVKDIIGKLKKCVELLKEGYSHVARIACTIGVYTMVALGHSMSKAVMSKAGLIINSLGIAYKMDENNLERVLNDLIKKLE
jgi:uncharacterized protein with GYD domain